MKDRSVDTKELGLDLGVGLVKFFLDSDYMHYGYWEEGASPTVASFKGAQSRYTQFLFDHIPVGVQSILDVGCGTGVVADELLEKGFSVECVSPPSILTRKAVERLGSRAKVHQSTFEAFAAAAPADARKFDLIFFSESFQYVDLEKVFALCEKLLRPQGHILLCDFFQTDAPGRSPLGGGHRLRLFRERQEQSGFGIERDLDITDRIAPSMQIFNRLSLEVIQPTWRLMFAVLDKKLPRMTRVLRWKYRARIQKFEAKHFAGERNEENFKKFKSYRLIVLKRRPAPAIT